MAAPASDPALDLDGPHWRFALDLYGRRGVAEACLTLQETADLDVVLMLFVLHARQERGIALDRAEIRGAADSIRDWREETVLPLRAIRQRLKHGPDPAPSAETEALRGRVKRAELEAEQIQLAFLARWLDRRAPPRISGAADTAELIGRCLPGGAAAATGPVAAAIATIAEAVRGRHS